MLYLESKSFLAVHSNYRAYSTVRLSSVTYVRVLWLNGASCRKSVSEETNRKWL